MSRIFDLLVTLAISAGLIMVHPTLGILFLLVNILFATQYWKTLLLIGCNPQPAGTGKQVKAAILAILFSAILYFVLNEESPQAHTETVATLWNGDFFPIVLSVSFLASLLMAALITEKRKR